MQHITGFQTTYAAQARPAVAANGKVGTRLAYIDTVRMILTILVIMVHTAVTYGAFGDWTYHDNTLVPDELSSILLSLFNFICQSFFMGLFFFFSGYFTPGSYDHKGIARFWKDRLLRLGIPMVVYTYFLSRIPNYFDDMANEGLTLSFWDYSRRTFLSNADAGPTWFLFALLIFSLGYTAWRLIAGGLRLNLTWASRLPAPNTKTLLGVGLVFSAAMFTIGQFTPISEAYKALNAYNLLLSFFPGYILMFAGGMLAYRNQWLATMPANMLKLWTWFSAALIVILPVYLIGGGAADGGLDPFLGGMTWQCAGLCLWFGMAAVALSVTLTLWMRRAVQPGNKLTALAAPNTFTVYLIHPLVLVSLSYGLSFIVLPGMVKFVLVSFFTVALCYGLADILRRLPGANAIL